MYIQCSVRNNLWTEYDAAVRRYIASVSAVLGSLFSANARCEEEDALAMVHDLREMIREHCLEHGCDGSHDVPQPSSYAGVSGAKK